MTEYDDKCEIENDSENELSTKSIKEDLFLTHFQPTFGEIQLVVFFVFLQLEFGYKKVNKLEKPCFFSCFN